MFHRSIPLIVAAIRLSRPDIPEDEAVRYAKVLRTEAREHDFDPFTGVAIIHFESYWHPGVVSKDREDYGLAQIRARYVPGCRQDDDPRDDPSPRCAAAKQQLLDGAANIRMMAALITANRKLCKEKIGRAWFHEWLASYQGRNHPDDDVWCKAAPGTWRVVNYRRELIRKLVTKQQRAVASKKKDDAPPKQRRSAKSKSDEKKKRTEK